MCKRADDCSRKQLKEVVMEVKKGVKEAVARLVKELEAGLVLRGVLRFPSESDTWAIGDTDLEYILYKYRGMQVVLILLPLGEPVPGKTCPICGDALAGPICRPCTPVDEGW